MQALPSANPVAPVAPVNSANVAAANAGVEAPVAADPGQSAPATFEQVLATQMDAGSMHPELILEAANGDWEGDAADGAVDPLAVLAQDPALAVQSPQLPVAPVAALTAAATEHAEVELDADGLRAEGVTLADARAGADIDKGADRMIEIGADLLKSGRAQGLQADAGSREIAPLESGAQSQPLHGPQESHRTVPAARPNEHQGFNPRVIPEPVKSSQWGEALGQRVVWMARENVQVVHLQVEPPNLGPIEVQLRLNSDQANLMFVSPHASVRDAISGSLAKLDELLSAGGVSLGSVSVNTQSPSQDSNQQSDGHGWQGQSSGWEVNPRTGEATRPAPPLVVGLVDVFA